MDNAPPQKKDTEVVYHITDAAILHCTFYRYKVQTEPVNRTSYSLQLLQSSSRKKRRRRELGEHHCSVSSCQIPAQPIHQSSLRLVIGPKLHHARWVTLPFGLLKTRALSGEEASLICWSRCPPASEVGLKLGLTLNTQERDRRASGARGRWPGRGGAGAGPRVRPGA